ncbi:MAG TPA: hypothetical protein VL490_08715 [Mucilaginibacter sp.]|jgi:hypothetical protein|nr:hypothetical protein [Mucilaginibacter sp.]
MKKLKLKLDGIKDMLTKEQMKKISGGYTGVPSGPDCGGWVACYCPGVGFVGCMDVTLCYWNCGYR